MVGWAFRAPSFHEFGRPNREPDPGIGVADPKDGAGDRLSFGNQKLQITLSRLGEAKNCNRPGFDPCFHRDSMTTFAMKKSEPA
jgi:hypothetical protein